MSHRRESNGWRVGLAIAGGAIGALAVLAAVGAVAVSGMAARRLLVPPRKAAATGRVIGLDADSVTIETVEHTDMSELAVEGRYGMWFDADRGHAKLGDVLEREAHTVRRRLDAIDRGALTLGARVRGGAAYYLHPTELGLDTVDVEIETELGPAPAWRIDAEPPTSRWAILVHGRAAGRHEAVRALRIFHDAGWNTLVVSYRNDPGAPAAPDGRYALGSGEWRDVESALDYVVDQGASDVVLMGWSMGGATVLQTLIRARHADLIRGVALDSPVVDWNLFLAFQGERMGLPAPVVELTGGALSRKWGGVLTGRHEPLDLASLDMVARADDVTVPVLLMHSDDDRDVPVAASAALAAARPDIVTFERFETARHVRLWNYDPQRWTGALTQWLTTLPTSDPPASD